MTWHNAYAARIDEENIVRDVIVIPHMADDDAQVTAYCKSIGLTGTWLDTSYLGARRKRFAGIGFYFDAERDEFVPPGFELIDGEWQDPNPLEPSTE